MLWMQLVHSPDPMERFAGIMMGLIEIAIDHGHRRRHDWLTPLYVRLTRIADRFARAFANRDKPPRIRVKITPTQPKPERPNAPPRPRSRLPGYYGWLAYEIPETRHAGRALLADLNDPVIAQFIATSAAARRIMRPLLNMLGVELPPILQLPQLPRRRPPPGHIPKPRIHPVCDYQPGPRQDELKAYRQGVPEPRWRKIRF